MAFDTETAPQTFAALGHAGRLSVFRMLMRFAPRPVRPSEIAQALDLKANTLSGYLSDLVDAGLVSSTRDGRALYYKVDMKSCEGLVGFLVNDCCRGRPDVCLPFQSTEPDRARPYRVLFLCSGNSARSIIAEALLRDLGEGRFEAFSAGTRPSGAVNPFVQDLLARNGHETLGLNSKDITTFQGKDVPDFDFVFTVCDIAASEDCAPWIGQPLSAHWGLPDPVKRAEEMLGTDAERALIFAKTYEALRRRIEAFTALPFESLDRLSLQGEIDTLSTL